MRYRQRPQPWAITLLLATAVVAFAATPATAGAQAVIPVAELRRTVAALYPAIDVESNADRSTPARMVVLLFDPEHNVIRHAVRTRTTDRVAAFEVLREEFGDRAWTDFHHTGVVALTGPRGGVEPGSVWVAWGVLRR